MEGSGAAGELAACGGARKTATAFAQGSEQRRVDVDVPVQAAEEVSMEAYDAGTSRRRIEQELRREAMEPGERQQRAPAPTALLSGRKRKRDDESEAEGSQQAAERLSATQVQVQQPAVALAPPPPPPLQRLLEACHSVFGVSRPPPMATIVPFIRDIMNTIGPHDVGLLDEMRFLNEMNTYRRRHPNPPIITCKTIHQSRNFTIAVFFLPKRAVMPLHDHPGMTVFSKLLIGSARVEAYDWVRPRILTTYGSRMLAEKVRDQTVTVEHGTWVLFPDAGGNLHRFMVGEDDEHCAFLDVLTPPYAPREQRACTYYHDSPYERSVARGGQRRHFAWLQEIPQPRSLRIIETA